MQIFRPFNCSITDDRSPSENWPKRLAWLRLLTTKQVIEVLYLYGVQVYGTVCNLATVCLLRAQKSWVPLNKAPLALRK